MARLGENIQAARKAHGFTQERLAELIDLHPRAVQKIEAGELNPKSTTLIRIQAAMRCSWDTLVAPESFPPGGAEWRPRRESNSD